MICFVIKFASEQDYQSSRNKWNLSVSLGKKIFGSAKKIF